uniref:LRRCT domain-containing protein n=1 Tax=Poecilia latipinna TaxID=48699 RepID=A0A3B3TQN7_9TELE
MEKYLSRFAEGIAWTTSSLVKKMTNKLLQVIPPNDKSNVSILVIKGNQITLNETDQQALATYTMLVELYLGENLVTTVPAKFFSGLSHLRVLSLSRNNIKNPWNCSCSLLDTIGRMKEANISFGQKPLLGHTWKFTACIAALGLTTCILILTAIKGPSWYKSFHNYRHRRLVENDEEEGQDTMPSETGGCESQQTFTFEELSHRIQEQDEEDGYFEDPYIKRTEDSEEEIQ